MLLSVFIELTDTRKVMSDKKATEQELQAWLDAVHFGSSCNLPLESKTAKVEKTQSQNQKLEDE